MPAAVSNHNKRRDLMSTCTDLNLGLSISLSPGQRQRLDWPPIKPLLRSTLNKLAEKADENDGHHLHSQQYGSLFVKVYMEGIPIGRKLDLFAHHGYNALVTTLSHISSKDYQYVLTYQDKEGDLMMVGDVPWEKDHIIIIIIIYDSSI
ncbi:hypothetical protein CICLE_v10006600mg [Citrus x clementina]|uniref:Auxin-responsive protein n=1 Tax=Citrus clementina TaxID=85681 RepID=V4S6B7_CITCL|nr:hypothetical protein CICLE_v10006600mg [Citrus x clementina]